MLVIVALLAQSGQLDEAAGAFAQVLLIPVQVVGVFVVIVQAAVESGIFSGGGTWRWIIRWLVLAVLAIPVVIAHQSGHLPSLSC